MLEFSRSVNILSEHHLEFLSLTGGYTGSSESTLVKMPHCWKSHVLAQIIFLNLQIEMNIWVLLLFGLVLRIALFVYGMWQDRTMTVKFTDVDYYVFHDAAEYMAKVL